MSPEKKKKNSTLLKTMPQASGKKNSKAHLEGLLPNEMKRQGSLGEHLHYEREIETKVYVFPYYSQHNFNMCKKIGGYA